MKPETSMIEQDRLATWEEISRANVASPDQIMKQFYKDGSYFEADSEWGSKIRYSAQEFEFFSYLSEMKIAGIN